MYARANARRRLRPQADRGLVAIREGVHLLAYDIRIRADGPREQIGLFENRQPDFPKIVGLENLTRGLLEPIPKRRIRRQDVARAFNGSELSFFSHFRGNVNEQKSSEHTNRRIH